MIRVGRVRVSLLAVTVLAAVVVAAASAAGLANGDFETGTLAGWTTFTTPDGTIGTPAVVSFDTTGNGASNAAAFNVGRTVPPFASTAPYAGGGIYQNVDTGGLFTVSADVATHNPAPGPTPQLSCGLFELLVDGGVVASHNFGVCVGPITLRSTLSATGVSLPAGQHEIRVRISRTFLSTPQITPTEYIDNVALTQTLPTSKDQCKNGGWQAYLVFKNQGDCVSYVATGGTNQPG
jgi:hypothetical protein